MFVPIPQSRVDNSCSANSSNIIITGLLRLVKCVFRQFAKKGENE